MKILGGASMYVMDLYTVNVSNVYYYERKKIKYFKKHERLFASSGCAF